MRTYKSLVVSEVLLYIVLSLYGHIHKSLATYRVFTQTRPGFKEQGVCNETP